MKLFMDKYKTIIMDCDGVILDSNLIKSKAFYQVAIPFGEDNANKLVTINKKYGGVSRYEKIHMFMNDILQIEDQVLEEDLIKQFGYICVDELMKCDFTPGLIKFLERTRDKDVFVVSGGSQNELRNIFNKRRLSKYFEGIYGSPETKKDLVEMLRDDILINSPYVFIGDSRGDYDAAESIGADFIFMSEFTEFYEWKRFFNDKKIKVVNNLSDLNIGNIIGNKELK